MSESNLRHWNVLGKTDPSQTKPFRRQGGFAGTATKPIWTEYRLTTHFGPCGIGWGYHEPTFALVPAGEEILVFCTVAAWYRDGENQSAPVYGVGGDKVLVKRQSGLVTDDEAYKKAFTDALGNAFKHIGSGADVHMGLFDDSKYVNEMRREFAEGPASNADTPERAVPVGTVVEDPFAPELPPVVRAPTARPAPTMPPPRTSAPPARLPHPEEPPAIGEERSAVLREWWGRRDYGVNPEVIDGGLARWDFWFLSLARLAPNLDALIKLKEDNREFHKLWYRAAAAPVSKRFSDEVTAIEQRLVNAPAVAAQ